MQPFFMVPGSMVPLNVGDLCE